MAEPTPGPWEAEFDGDGYLINGIIRVPRTYEEYPEDARLIAGSPDLLRTLRAIVESYERTGDVPAGLIAEGRQAIDEATRLG